MSPRSLIPGRDKGPPTEAEPAAIDVLDVADEEAGQPAPVLSPTGRWLPRFRKFRAGLAPPPPSAQYRADPAYTTRMEVVHASVQRAYANHRTWTDRHAQATTEITGWLASAGLLGDEAHAAYAARTVAERIRGQAEADVTAARARADQTQAEISEGVRRALAGEGDLPSGAPAVTARLGLEAAELVADEVKRSAPGVNSRWGQSLARADWRQALAQAELLDTPEAERAAVWLKAKISPPPGPQADPLGWIA
jgi:hypothetical protein